MTRPLGGALSGLVALPQLHSFADLTVTSKAIEDPSVKLKLEDYIMVRHLGSGAYANVKLAQHKKTKAKVAIKIYPKYKLNDATKRKAVQREIACMKKLDHPQVVRLFDNFETAKEIYLVQEFVSGVSLY